MEARWIPSLRESLHRFGASIQLDNDYVPRPEREHDRYIMDIAIQSALLDNKALRIINYCRLYLHITTVSEMFDASGVELLPHVKNCERPPCAIYAVCAYLMSVCMYQVYRVARDIMTRVVPTYISAVCSRSRC